MSQFDEEPLLDEAQVLALLSEQVRLAGGQNAYAREHGVPQVTVCRTLSRQRLPQPAITTAMGLKRVYMWKRMQRTQGVDHATKK